jgi:hypothetical protein
VNVAPTTAAKPAIPRNAADGSFQEDHLLPSSFVRRGEDSDLSA